MPRFHTCMLCRFYSTLLVLPLYLKWNGKLVLFFLTVFFFYMRYEWNTLFLQTSAGEVFACGPLEHSKRSWHKYDEYLLYTVAFTCWTELLLCILFMYEVCEKWRVFSDQKVLQRFFISECAETAVLVAQAVLCGSDVYTAKSAGVL